MTQCRIYRGIKFYIQDSWNCGHINLVINNISATRGDVDAISATLSKDLGVKFQDLGNSGQRVWGISRNQLEYFTRLTSEATWSNGKGKF